VKAKPLFIPALIAALVPGMFLVLPRPSQAMPQFAQATGLKCSACHTVVPLLNAFGRSVQYSGYALLDRHDLAKTFPVWIGESMNYDSTAGAGTGVPRFDFGNLAVHGIGYIAPDVTYHVQQWLSQGDQAGPLDTAWIAYNHVFTPDAHLFVGKILNPAPSIYSQNSDIDGPSASATLVGEHDWNATYGNRWGTKLVYVAHSLDVEAGYVLSGDDLNGLTDFNPGDKTFQWKVADTRPHSPLEVGVFGSVGSVPLSTGLDKYSSTAGYIMLDPGKNGRPGLFTVYQGESDSAPGMDPNGNPYPAANTRGFSAEVLEPVFRGNLLITYRHDFNDAGITGGTVNGNAINAAFNVPGTRYVHGYLESNLGGNSALSGASGGPTWKGMLWLTVPVKSVPNTP
jgi:hypothetical protein